ncbi:MAG: hypothetical protein GTN78_13130, partial [Gemmatimonadales bacterium]|nr:hypothetical protein [Gemmatimonadales bacterium]NIR01120.1 hypothetical protein [Gemmatimonadales bacterium]
PALSMLAGILRRKGDLVGSVAAAQRVSEVTVEADAPPGTIEQAREERAKIEEHVVRELGRLPREVHSPAAVFTSPGFPWYRSRHLYIALTSMGAIALFLAVVAILRGQLSGYVWFGISLFAAGWCYNDAESRREAGILWGPFVLCLGPFGLAIYLLATH